MSRSTLTDDSGKVSRYDVYIRTGLKFVFQHKFKAALKEFKKALKLDAELLTAHNNIGSVFILLAEYHEAIPHLEKALAINQEDLQTKKDDPYTFIPPSERKELNDFSIPFSLVSPNDLLLNYKDTVHIPQISLPQQEAVIIRNNLGLVYSKLEEYDNAMCYFNEVLNLDPLNALACSNLYSIYFTQDLLDKAKHYRVKTIELSLKIAHVLLQFDTVKASRDNIVGAISFCKEAIFYFELALDLAPGIEGFYI